ncbi:DUF833-domain-containing protein [Mycena vulgaris]|nr:DUF833-domain-containing protein [Mycena vulgaris]
MCVTFWTLDHPDYALILCANRDEYLARPTLAAGFHSFGPTATAGPDPSPNDEARNGKVLSGRDAQAGGTWLGLAPTSGRVALLTNITEPPQSLPSSRGALIPAFLLAPPASPATPLADELEALYPPAAQYTGFNLLVLAAEWEGDALEGDAPKRLHFPRAALLTNRGARGPVEARLLTAEERACGGLSNGVDGPGRAGVAEGRAGARTVCLRPWQGRLPALLGRLGPVGNGAGGADAEEDAAARDTALAARLFALLRTTASDGAPIRAREDLRRTICVPPLGINSLSLGSQSNATAGPGSSKEQTASPLGTPAPLTAANAYATRLATVLLVRRTGAALFVEARRVRARAGWGRCLAWRWGG